MNGCVITKFEGAHSPDDHYKNTWCEMRRKETKQTKVALFLQCRVNPTRDM